MPTTDRVQANRVRYVAITIPAAAGTAVTLESLVVAALNAQTATLGAVEKAKIMGGKVYAAGTAYTAGSSASSLPVAVGATAEFTEPAVSFLRDTFVKSSADALANVAVAVYLAGDGFDGR